MRSIEPTLSEQCNSLLLSLLFWLFLYACGLFATMRIIGGFPQAIAGAATIGAAIICVLRCTMIYRINKLMKRINESDYD